jgi:hypothetical protein
MQVCNTSKNVQPLTHLMRTHKLANKKKLSHICGMLQTLALYDALYDAIYDHYLTYVLL